MVSLVLSCLYHGYSDIDIVFGASENLYTSSKMIDFMPALAPFSIGLLPGFVWL